MSDEDRDKLYGQVEGMTVPELKALRDRVNQLSAQRAFAEALGEAPDVSPVRMETREPVRMPVKDLEV